MRLPKKDDGPVKLPEKPELYAVLWTGEHFKYWDGEKWQDAKDFELNELKKERDALREACETALEWISPSPDYPGESAAYAKIAAALALNKKGE